MRGEVWWAHTPSGDLPVLVLTRDPLADRLDAVVVAACTRTIRGVQSELVLDIADGMPERCAANFDNVHTVRRSSFRRRVTQLSEARMVEACRVLDRAFGCV